MAESRYRRNIFDPLSEEPHRLSRTKIDLFVNCPRCFYLDQRLGIKRPSMPAFSLNNAVDFLLKKEFDIHRAKGEPHPLMKQYKIDAVPFQHDKLEEWRDSLRRGISFLHKPTNLIIRGGVDDVWIKKNDELIIVDYKATSKEEEVSLDDKWKDAYKRQMEIYQWLFRQNNFKVSKTGYFVYVNGQTDRKAFDAKLEFSVSILPYEGKSDWIEKTIFDIKECLLNPHAPKKNNSCEYCNYTDGVSEALQTKKVPLKIQKQKDQTLF